MWASFAAASLRAATGADELEVRVDQPVLGRTSLFVDPDLAVLSAAVPVEPASGHRAGLIIKDMSTSRITGGHLAGAETPSIMIAADGGDLVLSFDFDPDQLEADAALAFLDGFAGRLEEPLRHLL